MNHRIKTIVNSILLLFIIFYFIISLYLSLRTYCMVEDSIHSEYKETYQESISSEMFEYLDMHSYSKKINVEFSAEYYTRWFVTYHWFSKAKCIYWYDSAIKTATPSNVLTKSKRIPVTVTFELRNGKWVVVDIFEPY